MITNKLREKLAKFLRRGIAKSVAELINRIKKRKARIKKRLARKAWGTDGPLLEAKRCGKPAGVRIAAIMMAKNECDIIEHCIRINLRSFDRIFVMDHNSTDPTKQILRLLIQEGLPLSLVEAPTEDAAYHQGELMTRMMQDVAKTGAFDFIMPLDADEFLVHHEGWHPLAALHLLRPNEYGLVPWITYVPTIDSTEKRFSLAECFQPRDREPRLYHKVVVGNEMAKDCRLNMGSHSLADLSDENAVYINTMSLQHLPVRSSSQIISKARTGANALRLKKNRRPDEGQHWLNMEQRFQGKTVLDLNELQAEALTYACHGLGDSSPMAKVCKENTYLKVGHISDGLRWPELAVVDLDRNLKAING